jgi:hypothetical protein
MYQAEMILKSHMVIVDFLMLQMPGMFDRLSIIITYQKSGGKEKISIPFAKAMEWQNQNLPPIVGAEILQPEIILPGLYNI